MDLMRLSARDISSKCLDTFQQCLTFRSTNPGLPSQETSRDERFEYRLADFNLWIDGIGALAPSKASLDSRPNERQIDLSLVKGNLIMLFQSLEDCLNLLTTNQPLEDALLDIDSALESLVSLSLAIRRTGRRSRLHKADRLFKPEEHAELRKHLEAIILLRPGPGPCDEDEFQKKIDSLTALQSHLVTSNLKRRNRFIQAHLHSLGLKKRSVGFELPAPGVVDQATASALSLENKLEHATVSISTHTSHQPSKPLPAPMSVTSASIPESKLEYKEPIYNRTESTPMTVITQITASARYPRPRVSDNEQKVVQCPCCCQTLPVSEAKNNNRWRKHLAEDIRPYTCIFDRCPAPDVYYSSRSMLEQHFRQDHPPVWICPLCDQGSVYSTMTEMMDHLHNTHAQAIGEDISSSISSSAQTRMGIESCPLCEVKGDTDSLELIDHVLEHVHDFSLRSLPWPESSEVELGGEVGSFNPEGDEAAAVTQWLDGYEHEMGYVDPTLKLSTCDYGRLAIIAEQIKSQKEDKLGLDIGFADEHGDESAEAETEMSQLTQDTLESVEEPKEDRELVYCHQCSAEWYRDEHGLPCPECHSEVVEIFHPKTDHPDLTHRTNTSVSPGPRPSSPDAQGAVEDNEHAKADSASKSSARESTSGFRRIANRLFSRKKTDDIEPEEDPILANIISQFPSLSPRSYSIFVQLYQRRIDTFIKKENTFSNFVRDVQGEDGRLTDYHVSRLDIFLAAMMTLYLDPLRGLPPKDLAKPISNYFIKSSHRTLLPGTFDISPLSSDSIRDALLAGYRYIDIDVWDGDEDSVPDRQRVMNVFDQRPNGEAVSTTKRFNRLFSPARDNTALKPEASKITLLKPRQSNLRVEPVVTDGLSFVSGFSFREACEVIKAFAFYNNDLPVIVNISVHATSDQQEMMVQIMKEEWDGYLVDEPLEACDPRFRLPNLEDLRNRILVTLSEASGRGLPNLDKLDKVRRGEREDDQGYIPIIRPLADLEIYMRTESFQGFDTPRTKVPSHVFSLQEERLQEVISSSQTYLFSDNKNYFLHVTPSPARQDSSNLGPLQFWQHGIQMAAINWHNVDEGMMLNEGMFADESGWVLKPDGYRSSDKNTLTHYEAASKDLTELSILIFAKQEVELTSKDRANSQTRGLSSLTRATLHLAGDSLELSAGSLLVKDEDSGALGYEHKLDMDSLGLRIIPKLSILRLKFANYLSGDDVMAWTCLRLDRLNRGYRLIPLYDDEGGLLSKQKLLVKINIKWLQ